MEENCEQNVRQLKVRNIFYYSLLGLKLVGCSSLDVRKGMEEEMKL